MTEKDWKKIPGVALYCNKDVEQALSDFCSMHKAQIEKSPLYLDLVNTFEGFIQQRKKQYNWVNELEIGQTEALIVSEDFNENVLETLSFIKESL